jgi:hypothetical protein
MSKQTLYEKVKRGWRDWDEDVYRLALSMEAAFSHVVEHPDADKNLVIEVKHLQQQIAEYRAWQSVSKQSA